MLNSFFKNRTLIFELTRREILGRYKGSFLGFFWSLITPLIMLLVYTFVFGVIFKSRWRTGSVSTYEYAVVMFAGVLVHGLLSECLQRAPTLIVGNVNYVKKVVFPLEIMTWVAIGTALFHMLIASLILLAGVLLWQGHLPWTVIYFPLILLPFIFLISGVVWAFSALGVYLRDLGQIVAIMSSLLIFLAPVFYNIDSIAEPTRTLLYLNPITFIVEQVRATIIWGTGVNWLGLLIYSLIAYSIALGGYFCFQKTRKGFADVL
jgi:lipopolysaccharide transport system permease protein